MKLTKDMLYCWERVNDNDDFEKSMKKRKCLCNLHKAGRPNRVWGAGASRQK